MEQQKEPMDNLFDSKKEPASEQDKNEKSAAEILTDTEQKTKRKTGKTSQTKAASGASKKKEEGKENLGVEACFARLDQILSNLEDSKTSLEDAFHLYEEGMKLVQQADMGIGKIEKKLRILSGEDEENSDGAE